MFREYEKLFQALKGHFFVEHLVLSNNGFTVGDIKDLVNALLCKCCRIEAYNKNKDVLKLQAERANDDLLDIIECDGQHGKCYKKSNNHVVD